MQSKKDEESPTAPDPQPALIVGNLWEPIRLKDVNLAGVSAEATQGGGTVKVWTRLILSSDEPFFHRVVDGVIGGLRHLAQQVGQHINFGRADSILLVIRPDQTAELWVDGAAVSAQILPKRDIKAGAVVFESDIADVTGLDFPSIDIGPKDKVLYLFREDWQFGLFFDFNPDNNLSRKEMSATLGTLYRRLKYRHLYDMVADEAVFTRLIDAGWFPFVEIIGPEFKELASHAEAGFPFAEVDVTLLEKFNDARLDRMFQRWIAKPTFKSKEAILKSAINSYKGNDPIAVLKIILTEIEGILADSHYAKTGTRAKLKQLLKFAHDSAEQKSGALDTLLFPAAFTRYLERHTFANFDPSLSIGDAGSRHAVGHGAATAASYTKTRALQALLTLDQFAFYLS